MKTQGGRDVNTTLSAMTNLSPPLNALSLSLPPTKHYPLIWETVLK